MRLIILGLPLGNIQDISLRAIETLKNAQIIICEDTRVFHKLWQKLLNLELLPSDYQGRLIVLNDFNERDKTTSIVENIQDQEEVVLVSDAGMPLVSDPGFRLVKEAINRNWSLTVIPGPTALTTALATSGFSGDKILFLGFLPKKTSKRFESWQLVKGCGGGVTVVIYESPYRVKKTIIELSTVFGEETEIVVSRELTKLHEEIIRGKAGDLQKTIKVIKGEVVILFRI
jgi:16S rRNA (cytidine1402-2'-O)-methyltransferase